MVWAGTIASIILLRMAYQQYQNRSCPQEDSRDHHGKRGHCSRVGTLEETGKVLDKVENILKNTPEVEHYARVAGYGFLAGQGTSYGMAIIRLKNWDERKGAEHVSDAVVARLNAQFAQIKEAQIFCFQPGMIPGYGLGNSVELNLQDRTRWRCMSTFYGNAMQYIGALNQRPEVAMAYTSYAMNFPQISVDVDAAKCKRAGISPSMVLDVLGSYVWWCIRFQATTNSGKYTV
ncbi:MAG: efflux RND transporter permease subunit [Parabacteroides merdae]